MRVELSFRNGRLITRDDAAVVAEEPRLPAGTPTEGNKHGGEWTAEGAAAAAAKKKMWHLHPKAIDVGGDDWNKNTAVRLETQYQSAKEELDKTANDLVGAPATGVKAAKTWNNLTSDQMDEAKEHWKHSHYDAFHDSEVNNWYESGSAESQAQYEVYNDSDNDSWMKEAIEGFIKDREENGEKPLPFDAETLWKAITLENNGHGYAKVDDANNDGDAYSIGFDNSKLDNPVGFNKDQLSLPGMENVDPAKFLTDDMRKEIADAVMAVFEDEVNTKKDNVEPPDYIEESVQESLEDYWDQMDEDEKFKVAKDSIDDLGGDDGEDNEPVTIPDKIDPLNVTTGDEYRATQRLAKTLSIHRAADLIVKRGLIKNPNEEGIAQNVKDRDDEIWSAWKNSSTSYEGKLLQIATADELGGRLREETFGTKDDIKKLKSRADSMYSDIGGYEGIKAYVRAKWETTQWLLDKANVHELNLYRAVDIPDLIKPKTDPAKGVTATENFIVGKFDPKDGDAAKEAIRLSGIFRERFYNAATWADSDDYRDNSDYYAAGLRDAFKTLTSNQPAIDYMMDKLKGVTANDVLKVYKQAAEIPVDKNDPGYVEEITAKDGHTYEFLPNLTVKRNGAASTSTDRNISNAWDGSANRVVLRAHVPRTACISIPAYGENVQSEHEVVVGGTAWTGWDAWHGRAPDFKVVSLGRKPTATPEQISALNKINEGLTPIQIANKKMIAEYEATHHA